MKTNLKTAGLSLLGLVFLSSVIYALGVLDFASSSANPSTKQGLSVQGVPNKVEYLQALTISGTDGKKVKLEYMSASGYLEISGAVNMDSLVVGTNNQAGKHSAVFGGGGNQANATASAVVGGQQNLLKKDSTNSVIAGSNNALLEGTSEQVFIGAKNQNSSHQNSSNQNVIVLGNSSANHSQNTFVAGTNSVSNSRFSVVLGTGISLGDKSNVFVYSNSGSFSPQTSNAFYVNAKKGVAVNHDQVNAQLDINGGLALKRIFQGELPTLNSLAKGTIVMVQKGQQTGLCGRDGKKWLPLSENAKGGICESDVSLPQRPINNGANDLKSSTVRGSASNASLVTTRDPNPSLPKLWNDVNGEWENPIWTYNTNQGPGQYICGVGYHTNTPNPNGVFTQNCQACSYIDNMYSWTTDGKGINNCDFTCSAGYKYSADNRTCTACGVGTYTVDGNASSTCSPCTGLPENATWTSKGTSATSCSWSCDPGHVEVNGQCEKVEWTEERGDISCKLGGFLHEGERQVNPICSSSDGAIQPDEVCNVWSNKPQSRSEFAYQEDCNYERWNCDVPNCSSSGECGGRMKQVSCTARAKNENGKEYSAHKEDSRACDRPCENGQCNRTYHRGQAQNLTQNSPLCANGTIANFQPTMRNSIVTGWTWACNAKDANIECISTNQTPGSAKCAPDINKCSAGEVHDVADTAEAVKWECRSSVPGANNASCIICKSGYQDDGNKNCVPIPQGRWECLPREKLFRDAEAETQVYSPRQNPSHQLAECTGGNCVGESPVCGDRCVQGYEQVDNGDGTYRCEKNNYQCTGTVPANATLIAGDDQGLVRNVSVTVVASNSDAKCEYMCNVDYVLGTDGVCRDASLAPRCPAYLGPQKNVPIGSLPYMINGKNVALSIVPKDAKDSGWCESGKANRSAFMDFRTKMLYYTPELDGERPTSLTYSCTQEGYPDAKCKLAVKEGENLSLGVAKVPSLNGKNVMSLYVVKTCPKDKKLIDDRCITPPKLVEKEDGYKAGDTYLLCNDYSGTVKINRNGSDFYSSEIHDPRRGAGLGDSGREGGGKYSLIVKKTCTPNQKIFVGKYWDNSIEHYDPNANGLEVIEERQDYEYYTLHDSRWTE